MGGPAIHTILLTQLLHRQRFQTQLVTGTEGTTEGTMRYLAEERNVPLTEVQEMGREISWKDDLIALRKLIALMRREKPDIVHTHTAKAGALGRAAAIIALWGRKKRLYHTFHGHVFHSYFGPIKTRIFILIEQILALFTNRILAVSPNTRNDLIAYKIAPPEKIIVVPLGLDLDPFAKCKSKQGELRKSLNLPEKNVLLIGLVARLVPVKGIHIFLQAIHCLQATHPDIHVVLVGDGELRSDLECQTKQLELTDKVHFLGYRKDLPTIYADLDMVVLSSLNEGTPVSIIEAMASGCIVVSTDVGGVSSLIRDNETGFLVPPKDPKALAKGIATAIEQRSLWKQMTKTAQEETLQRFHITRLVSDIERLYSEP